MVTGGGGRSRALIIPPATSKFWVWVAEPLGHTIRSWVGGRHGEPVLPK